jgi:hypothetical protein
LNSGLIRALELRGGCQNGEVKWKEQRSCPVRDCV